MSREYRRTTAKGGRMLNLSNANKVYTDTELLESAAKYIKGFVGRTIRDLQETK